MTTLRYTTGAESLIRIGDCAQGLSIYGWDQQEVEVVCDQSEQQLRSAITQQEGLIEIEQVSSRLALRVPRAAQVEVRQLAGAGQLEDIGAARLKQVAGDLVLRCIAGDVEIAALTGDLLVNGAGRVVVLSRVEGDVDVAHAALLEIEQVCGDLHAQSVPTVQVAHVLGDCQISDASERCYLGQVEGDAQVDNCGQLTVDQLQGDLEANHLRRLDAGEIRGDVELIVEELVALEAVNGDLEARIAVGPLRVAQVRGDADVRGCRAGAELGNVKGDLKLAIVPEDAASYRANVAGDALVHLDESASVVLQAIVRGDISGLGPRMRGRQTQGAVSFTFGTGTSSLDLTVGGDLRVRGGGTFTGNWKPDLTGFVEEMAQLGRELADMGREVGREMGRSFGVWGPHGRRGARGRRSGRDQGPAPVPPTPPVPPAPPRPHVAPAAHSAPTSGPAPAARGTPAPPASPATGQTVGLRKEAPPASADEARLAILRMVAEGRLSPEEADGLLATLD